jgi:SAM-dependent methyltransferase
MPNAMGVQTRRDASDEFLQQVVSELFAHDQRVQGMNVTATVDGGVVHLRGSVERADDLARLRALIGRLAGVLAVWDRVRVSAREPVILDLGCGDQRQYATNYGVDRRQTPSVSALADVSRPLPFRDASVDRIFAVHVLEHLIDYLPLVDECHRVLRPGGVLHVLSPWWKHVNAVADPTHVRFLDTQTVKGICSSPGRPVWHPLHVSRDDATVFADLTPGAPGDEPDPRQLARFFD